MMKRYIVLIALSLITIGASAQKAVRKSVREGNKAYKEQLYGNAEAEYKKAMEANPAAKEASFNLANTYYKQQRWDEALQEYQHYLTIETEDLTKIGAAWGNMGNAFLKKKAGEKDQAQQQPEEQGQQKQQADNLQMSMEAYKNSLRVNPLDNEVRHNLAVVQKMLSDQQNKDQNKDDDQDQDKQDEKEDKQDQEKPQDQPQDDKQDKQEPSQVSQDNVEQILKAMEQDEKETQERVKQTKAQERQRQNQHNRRHDKNW